MKLAQTEDTPQIERALANLNSRNREKRAEAEAAVAALGNETVEALLRVVAKEAASRAKRRRMLVWVLVGYVFLMVGVPAIGAIWFHGAFSSMTSTFTSFAGVFAAIGAMSQLQRTATKQLAECDDVRAVGFLAEALESQDKNLYAVSRDALMRLLPRLQASDADLLTGEQLLCLHHVLAPRRARREAELQVTVLKALEQIGDEKSLAIAGKLAASDGQSPEQRRVRAAAAECLPALRERVERRRVANTLLRATGDPLPADQSLVRPASSDDPAVDNLVRPSDQP